MQVGDLVYVKDNRRLGIALITSQRKVFNSVDCKIVWSTENPERACYMFIYEQHLELVSEGG